MSMCETYNGVSPQGNSPGREMSQHQAFNNSPGEEVGFKINTKLQSSFLIMLFPIRSLLFPKRFISCKGQKSYHKALLKGISSSVHNPEEH